MVAIVKKEKWRSVLKVVGVKMLVGGYLEWCRAMLLMDGCEETCAVLAGEGKPCLDPPGHHEPCFLDGEFVDGVGLRGSLLGYNAGGSNGVSVGELFVDAFV